MAHLDAAEPRSPPITIERVPPTVRRVQFTPSNPPPEMRRMKGGEAAFTQYDFNCAVNVKYENVSETRGSDGQVQVVARVHAVRVRLTLDNRIYVPDNANVPLRSHEEGHREINEQVYNGCEPVARELAERIMAKDWPGTGSDADVAGKRATDAAVKELCDAYLERIAGRATRVGEYFDQITMHGTRPVAITKAIEQAFERDLKRASPTTQPQQPVKSE